MKLSVWLMVLACAAGAVTTVLLGQEERREGDRPAVRDGDRPAAEARREGEPRREGEARRDGEARREGEVRREGEARREGEGRREPERVRLPEQAAQLDKVVGFSEDQKQKIVELQRAREAAVREANARFQAGLNSLMTPEQKAKWEAATKEAEKRERERREGERREGERREGERREGERREGERPAMRPADGGAVSAGSPAEGTAAEGMVVARGEDWISVKGAGDATGTRYTTDDKELIAAIGRLAVPVQVAVTYRQEGEVRKLLSVRARPIATEGVLEAVVTAKGDRWIEVKPVGDGPAERYLTLGEANDVVAAIAGVPVGEKVRLTWKFIERKRVMRLEKAAAGE